MTDQYRTWETISHVLDEKNAANRLAQHWHGSCVTTSQFAPFDRVLMHPLGGVAAVVEIKVRTYPLEYFAAHRFMLSYHKVKTLNTVAKQRSCVALIMVACQDDDFVIDLRDETGMTIERRKTWGNRASVDTGERLHHEEDVCLFAGARFIPLWAIRSLLE